MLELDQPLILCKIVKVNYVRVKEIHECCTFWCDGVELHSTGYLFFESKTYMLSLLLVNLFSHIEYFSLNVICS